MAGTLGSALAEALRIGYGDASADWFRPVAATVDAIDARTAASTDDGRNAPWQVLEHLGVGYRAWGQFLATGRLDRSAFDGHEWQPLVDTSADAWLDTRERTNRAEAAFREIVSGLDESALTAPERALGGSTRLDVVLCTLAHLGYHAGELATLCLADEGSPAEA